jgi:phosphate transport system substrate-binding protein
LVPITAGGIVISYNLPEVKELKLPRAVFADIFLGKVTTWNDPRIAAANPGVKLPAMPINVVHRSDGSGTTAVFSQHLAAVSPEWKTKVGAGKSLQWPVGTGAKGNEGVSAQLLQSKGSIGYVEYGFAQQNHMQTAALENNAGHFVNYSPKAAKEALSKIAMPENFVAFASDPAGATAYPIVSYTWLLMYRHYDDHNKAAALKTFLDWALTDGQKVSDELGYVPLPATLSHKLHDHIKQIE